MIRRLERRWMPSLDVDGYVTVGVQIAVDPDGTVTVVLNDGSGTVGGAVFDPEQTHDELHAAIHAAVVEDSEWNREMAR